MFEEIEYTLTKNEAIVYESKKIIPRGKTGESRSYLISGQFSIIRNPIIVVIEAIVALPRAINMPPIPLTKVNLAACFKKRVNPLTAAVQKFSDVKAI